LQAYQILPTGTHAFSDPANIKGSWDGNFNYRYVHTRSSREPEAPNYDCRFSGGVDSRFDFLLVSPSIQNSTMNVSYIDSSYALLSNNGSVFNKTINNPANTSDPDICP
jgi:hypothetical protein